MQIRGNLFNIVLFLTAVGSVCTILSLLANRYGLQVTMLLALFGWAVCPFSWLLSLSIVNSVISTTS